MPKFFVNSISLTFFVRTNHLTIDMKINEQLHNLIIQTKETIQKDKKMSAGHISMAEQISDKEWVIKHYSKDRFCLVSPENEHTIS